MVAAGATLGGADSARCPFTRPERLARVLWESECIPPVRAELVEAVRLRVKGRVKEFASQYTRAGLRVSRRAVGRDPEYPACQRRHQRQAKSYVGGRLLGRPRAGERNRRAHQPYRYYAPPPVVYAPPPSPGISLFFDLPFRHR